ncbi:MAG: hypothetical protein WBQ94_10815 [Terracidiphilus sp.]
MILDPDGSWKPAKGWRLLKPSMPVGRVDYALRILMIAVLWIGLHLLSGKVSGWVAQAVRDICIAILGMTVGTSLEGRLADAGWRRWCIWPYFCVLLLATIVLTALKFSDRTIGFFILVFILTPAILPQRGAASGEFAPGTMDRAGSETDRFPK